VLPGSKPRQAMSPPSLITLGGPDSAAWIINDRGQIAGESFTSFTANPSSGVPTIDPFFWDPNERKMIDLGGLGGTFGAPVFINGRGQVVGVSNPPGDTTEHPFIWSKSEGLRDLGTLGGTFGHPDSINDAGEVVGYATILGDQAGHAFLWRNGKMTDLGTLGTDPQSESVSINSQGQVAGETFTDDGIDLRGFLWENGGSPVDLNTLIVPGSITYVAAASVHPFHDLDGSRTPRFLRGGCIARGTLGGSYLGPRVSAHRLGFHPPECNFR